MPEPTAQQLDARARTAFVPCGPLAGSDQPTAPAAEDTDPRPQLPDVPGYKLIGVAGKGGMGNVFEAIHLTTGRRVALKLILTGWAAESEFRARLEREARTLARHEHPNIVPIYDAGLWHGQPFITMKFVPGATLAHRLHKLRLDLPAACRLLATVARAVGYLHSEGTVHRDLKPLNVLIAEDGTPMVADFGLARSVSEESDLTATGQPVGTQPYMSPEQIAGGKESARASCDIWALGVILYELLAGDRPFEHDERAALFRLIQHAPTPPIPVHMLAPPELEAVARKCLAKNPADRYASAEALAQDLEAWASGCPLVLPPEPPAPVFAEPAPAPVRPPRRPWARVALIAGAVLALASGGAPVPPKPPTDDDLLDRGKELVLVDTEGAIKYPVEPTLPGSALHPHEGGFALMSSDRYHVVRFKTGARKFPLEVSAEVMHLNSKDLPNYGGLALGQQRVSAGGIGHELVWTFGVTGGKRQLVGDQVRLTDRAYGLLTMVSRFDKRHDDLVTCEPNTFIEKLLPQNVVPMASWHRVTVVLDPTGIRATVDGKPLPIRSNDLARTMKEFRNVYPIDEVPAPLGNGIGLFTFGGDTAFRNVTIRRPR